MISMMLAVALLLADAAAQPAAAEPAGAEQAAKKAKTNKDGLICKNEPVLGSRMKTKLCMTAEQWEERKASDRETLERQQRINPPNG